MRCATRSSRAPGTRVISVPQPLLRVRGLDVTLGATARTAAGGVRAVDGLDLELAERECLGVVGESGSGKTQLLLALLGLSPPGARVAGSVSYRGEELLGAPRARLQALRGRRIAIVFQEAQSALNPYLSIATQLTEGPRRHLGLGRRAARTRAAELLALVQVDEPLARLRQYPHELSGGMRQRVLLAMALCCDPEILLLDEPTTALDVSVQAQVLAVLREVRARTGVAMLFVTHDLGALASSADRVAVMYAGRLVEQASAPELYATPLHPYTAGLLRSLPLLDRPLPERLPSIPGQPPDLAALPPGCAFAPRCPLRHERCATRPALLALEDRAGARALACHYDGPAAARAGAWA